MRYNYSRDELMAARDSPWFTDRQRQVLELFYLRGWKIAAIAVELSGEDDMKILSETTIKRDLRKIREVLETCRKGLDMFFD